MSSRELEDFTGIIYDTVKQLSRQSKTVRLLEDEIASDNRTRDLAYDVIKDIFDDADRDDQLYGRNDDFNEAIIGEATYAVLGVVADDVLDSRDWDDLSKEMYKSLETGIEIHKDALDRLKDNNYDDRSRRSRGRGRDNRDRDDRDRGRDRDRERSSRRQERSQRPRRSRGTGTDKRSGGPVRAQRAYNGATPRKEREGDRRDQNVSEDTIRDLSSHFIDELKDTGITDMAKLFGQMTDQDITIDDLVQFRADRAVFKEFQANRADIMVYLENKAKPVFGGNALNSPAGLVLDNTRVLVDGVVKPVEHYMDHELSDKARRGNMARYGMQPERHVRVPHGVEEEQRFREVQQLNFVRSDALAIDTPYSEMVDYSDVAAVAVDALNVGDVVFGDIHHNYTATVNFEQISRMMEYVDGVYVPPRTWNEMHQMMHNVITEIVENKSMDLSTPAITRIMGMLEDSATDYLNQCLTLAGVSVTVENFYDDYRDALDHVNGLDRATARDFFALMQETFNDMFKFTVETVEDGAELTYRVIVARTTPVLYTSAPVFGNETLLTSNGYNMLTAGNAPTTYEMVDSALRLRTNRAEMVMVDKYNNRYAVNCIRAGAGQPIIVREL